jgi:hypothetical protein
VVSHNLLQVRTQVLVGEMVHLGYQFPGNDYGKFNKTNRNECEWDMFDDGYLNKNIESDLEILMVLNVLE